MLCPRSEMLCPRSAVPEVTLALSTMVVGHPARFCERGLACRVWTAYRSWSAERNSGAWSPGSGIKMLPILNGNFTRTPSKRFDPGEAFRCFEW
ncbi:hypothetical protein Pla52o_16320 [Novipirellula galeiformis]|uniref:Uncharacterized protein n=1 Tax=Novipirellula galeiformis TaxID=2528004 RepID=A0A5C6CKC9_9BACT|nr:hypothetical protein Pla52o_16320 [Novipirellula galeiformis]